MTRIAKLFQRKNKGIVNIYCTAGYPRLESTLKVMRALQESGADMIELGMPYSDPLADGPVIQRSSTIALKNGMTINALRANKGSSREPLLWRGWGDHSSFTYGLYESGPAIWV